MKIKFYGVRGSYPKTGMDTVRYGGNTSCVSITKIHKDMLYRIIIDCGTGVINLGKEIVKNYLDGKEKLNITMLFTHLHPDHTQGFPFFAPNFFSSCNIRLMGMKCLKKHIGNVLEQEMLPPTFPIEYKDLKSTRKHYELIDGQTFYIKELQNTQYTPRDFLKIEVMQSYGPSHPQQGATYYKVTDLETKKSVACIWDIESHPGGDQRIIKFAKDCDIMIHDTQYTEEEYNSDKIIVQGFGHSTYDMAIKNAQKAGIKKQLIGFHFNPNHTDDDLDIIQKKLWKRNDQFTINLANEDMEIEI